MRYRFHPEALTEYIGSIDFYLDIDPNLAEAFISDVESGIERILANPEAWQPLSKTIRRYLLTKFPFGLYYSIEDNNLVYIYAVMHMSRHPDYWKHRK